MDNAPRIGVTGDGDGGGVNQLNEDDDARREGGRLVATSSASPSPVEVVACVQWTLSARADDRHPRRRRRRRQRRRPSTWREERARTRATSAHARQVATTRAPIAARMWSKTSKDGHATLLYASREVRAHPHEAVQRHAGT